VKSGVVEKTATVGALLTAAACPACFPMLAVVGTALGLGIFRAFEGWVFIVFQTLVVLALVGTVLSFLRHRRLIPLIVGLSGPLLIFLALYFGFNQFLLYLGLFGLIAASVLNFLANRQCTRC
jgi:mercuric ion transport protein